MQAHTNNAPNNRTSRLPRPSNPFRVLQDAASNNSDSSSTSSDSAHDDFPPDPPSISQNAHINDMVHRDRDNFVRQRYGAERTIQDWTKYLPVLSNDGSADQPRISHRPTLPQDDEIEYVYVMTWYRLENEMHNLEAMRVQNDDLAKDKAELISKLAQARSDKYLYQHDANTYKKDRDELQRDLHRLEKERDGLRTETAHQRDGITQLKQAAKDSDARAIDLQAQLDATQVQLHDLQKSQQNHIATDEILKNVGRDLEVALRDNDNLIKALETAQNDLSQQRDREIAQETTIDQLTTVLANQNRQDLLGDSQNIQGQTIADWARDSDFDSPRSQLFFRGSVRNSDAGDLRRSVLQQLLTSPTNRDQAPQSIAARRNAASRPASLNIAQNAASTGVQQRGFIRPQSAQLRTPNRFDGEGGFFTRNSQSAPNTSGFLRPIPEMDITSSRDSSVDPTEPDLRESASMEPSSAGVTSEGDTARQPSVDLDAPVGDLSGVTSINEVPNSQDSPNSLSSAPSSPVPRSLSSTLSNTDSPKRRSSLLRNSMHWLRNPSARSRSPRRRSSVKVNSKVIPTAGDGDNQLALVPFAPDHVHDLVSRASLMTAGDRKSFLADMAGHALHPELLDNIDTVDTIPDTITGQANSDAQLLALTSSISVESDEHGSSATPTPSTHNRDDLISNHATQSQGLDTFGDQPEFWDWQPVPLASWVRDTVPVQALRDYPSPTNSESTADTDTTQLPPLQTRPRLRPRPATISPPAMSPSPNRQSLSSRLSQLSQSLIPASLFSFAHRTTPSRSPSQSHPQPQSHSHSPPPQTPHSSTPIPSSPLHPVSTLPNWPIHLTYLILIIHIFQWSYAERQKWIDANESTLEEVRGWKYDRYQPGLFSVVGMVPMVVVAWMLEMLGLWDWKGWKVEVLRRFIGCVG